MIPPGLEAAGAVLRVTAAAYGAVGRPVPASELEAEASGRVSLSGRSLSFCVTDGAAFGEDCAAGGCVAGGCVAAGGCAGGGGGGGSLLSGSDGFTAAAAFGEDFCGMTGGGGGGGGFSDVNGASSEASRATPRGGAGRGEDGRPGGPTAVALAARSLSETTLPEALRDGGSK